jgi:beta-glucosidase
MSNWMRTSGVILGGLIAALLLCGAAATRLAAQTPDYQNQDLPFDVRARDLVSRMTLEEKVSQMQDTAPAIKRLGVPAYGWWNEALHGVARSGLATSFPQAIGLAAMWDDPLMHQMATAISDEARAKYQDYLRRNGLTDRYQGLTFWSPNINLFRDPRWGRGQETYGEDPYLTGRLAVQFIRGLQGDDPKYPKTVSTVKHFAVHSGPEPERHEFNAFVSERDLRESYLPQFEAGIREGGADSLMCAYNSLYGEPACANQLLLQKILRGEWGFQGYVVSDCDSIQDIYRDHKFVATPAEAAAVGAQTGTDLDCGRTYEHLIDAVHQGLISESAINTAVIRLFLARFRLGMFDSPDKVRWARTPMSELDSPANRELALKTARESMVLLKNAGGLLPLRRDLGTIAVIGPNADEWRMLLGNYNGIPSDAITPLRGIREAVSPQTRVLYSSGTDLAENFPVLSAVSPSVLFTSAGQPGLDVEYYSSNTMQGQPLFKGVDTTVNADWGEGAPRSGMNPDNFGVRWTGTVRPAQSGMYRFGMVGTMKFQLYLDDKLITQSVYATHDGEYPDPRIAQAEQAVQLEAGRSYKVRVDAEESYGQAQVQLLWAPPHELLEAQAIQMASQADVVVMVLGLTSRMEGEEMKISVPGFQGGDRTSLVLPETQEHLLQQVVALGKPTVLVLLNGSALAVNWAQDHVPAILEAWYPGQAAGTAIADVLFGNYNPGGRLPVTFYRSVKDLPPFENYNMAGRTYRFFNGVPLYPFGFGLSYTTFGYDQLKTSADTIPANGSVTVSVDVTNTGSRAGDEVVQLYVKHMGSAVKRPNKDLRGYQRVTLKPGETRTVQFPLAALSLAYWNPETHAWVVENEPISLEIGASSADIRLEKTISVAAAP